MEIKYDGRAYDGDYRFEWKTQHDRGTFYVSEGPFMYWRALRKAKKEKRKYREKREEARTGKQIERRLNAKLTNKQRSK